MKRSQVLVVAALLSILAVRPAFGVVATIPTALISGTSLVVGGAGVLGGESWWLRGLGYAVGIVDPMPATFYHGKIVMSYPETLLAPTAVGWFGNFALNPALPVPPVTSAAFFDTSSTPYDWQQLPNPDLNVSINAAGGLLTVEFDAPGGITDDSGAHFNLLSVQFQNISGHTVSFSRVDPSDSANFFSNSSQQTLTCRPDPSYIVPVTCGDDTPSARYMITTVPDVPEPASLVLCGTGILTLLGHVRRRRRQRLTPGPHEDFARE